MALYISHRRTNQCPISPTTRLCPQKNLLCPSPTIVVNPAFSSLIKRHRTSHAKAPCTWIKEPIAMLPVIQNKRYTPTTDPTALHCNSKTRHYSCVCIVIKSSCPWYQQKTQRLITTCRRFHHLCHQLQLDHGNKGLDYHDQGLHR